MDNATGTAELLEVARAFAAGPQPARTVVFAAWTAEEKGLLGAEAYAANPTCPLARTAAVINLDPHVVLPAARDVELIGGGRTELELRLAEVAAKLGLRVTLAPNPEAGWYFGIVADRYDARKALVREEANAIRTAWARSDFLREPDRGEAVRLLRAYLEGRLSAVRSYDMARLCAAVLESGRIQRQLWDMAVVNARKDMNSDVAALYVESLNDLASLHASRVNVGLHARLPGGLWLALYALVAVSMLAVGYHTAIARSRRSWITMMLALSFSLVITLIAALDRPEGGYLPVSQQPLEDLRATMDAGLEAPAR